MQLLLFDFLYKCPFFFISLKTGALLICPVLAILSILLYTHIHSGSSFFFFVICEEIVQQSEPYRFFFLFFLMNLFCVFFFFAFGRHLALYKYVFGFRGHIFLSCIITLPRYLIFFFYVLDFDIFYAAFKC